MAVAEPVVTRFRAMGSSARVVVCGGPPGVVEEVRRLIERLERLWSRFLDTSEISALNRAPGAVTVISPSTYRLIEKAAEATRLTGGRFNPLMLNQLEALGYRRSWVEGPPVGTLPVAGPATAEPIVLYPEINAVRLPPGTRFDPGGIGKGLAVDLAIEFCRAQDVDGASVELGGDLRVCGSPWYGSRWRIGVADPFDPSADVATFTPTAGAVTTSSTRKRRWTAHGVEVHHILDPRTGLPSAGEIAAITTCSEVAWWSEVAAKTAVVAGAGGAIALLRSLGTPGVVVTTDGRVHATDDRHRELVS